MESFKEECIAKSGTILKLQQQIQDLQLKLSVRNIEIKQCVKQKQEAEEQLNPVKSSLNAMTAAHGKLLRKLNRQGNKS